MSDAAPVKTEAAQQVAEPAPATATETVATEAKQEDSVKEDVKQEDVKQEDVKEETKEDSKEDNSKTQDANASTGRQERGSDRANGRPRHHQKRPANSKFDASLLPETDDPVKIRAQVEFYFSDSNLPTDKFMWDQTGGSENKPVQIKKICEFRRMRRFQPYEAVVAALRDSKSLNISGPEGEEEITRKVTYEPNQHRGKAEAATVYVKGFGDEEPSTQFDLEAFFTQYGPVNAVRLRRADDKLFKGSVYVEFQDEEDAKKFLALDPKPQWKGNDLKIMSKKDYVDEKNTLIREGKIEPSSRPQRFYEGRETGKQFRGGRGRGGKNIDRDDWKSRRDYDQKNGFRRGGGRGGRGRGRGGFRGDRDRNREREERERDESKPSSDNKETASDATNKRAREEDGPADAPPAKKVDAKEQVTAEGS